MKSIFEQSPSYVARRVTTMGHPLKRYIQKLFVIIIALIVVIAAWIYVNRNKVNRSIEEAISGHIQGTFTFDGVAFSPFYKGLGMTFVFREVAITDTLLLQPILYAQRVGIRVSLGALFNQDNMAITKIMLDDGYFKMIKNRQGYINTTAFSKKESRGTHRQIVYPGLSTELLLDNFAMSYYDSTKHKSYRVIAQDALASIGYEQQQVRCGINGELYFDGLQFNEEKGSFLKDKMTQADLKFSFNFKEQLIELYQSTLVLHEHYPVSITGQVHLADTSENKQGNYAFHFVTKQIPAPIALSHLTPTLEKKIAALQILPIVDATVVLQGAFQQKHPFVEVKFDTDTFDYAIKEVALTKLRASGMYTSQADSAKMPSDSNSKITCHAVAGFFESLPFQATINVHNLLHPVANITYAVNATMYDLNKMLDPTKYKIKEGEIALEGVYNGRIDQLYNAQKDEFNGHLIGNLSVKNLAGEFIANQLSVTDVNASMHFGERAICVDSLSFKKLHDQYPMFIEGEVNNVISSLLEGQRPIHTRLSVFTKHWDLQWIDKLQPVDSKDNTQKQSYTHRSKEYKTSRWIERVLGKFELDANLHAVKVSYQDFWADNVRGDLKMNQDQIALHSLAFNAFEGEVTLAASIRGLSKPELPEFSLEGVVNKANVKTVFSQLGNFGQSTLTDRNLEGILKAKFSLNGQLLSGGNIAFPSLTGYLDFDLSKARIINFAPFLKIKKVIFKNRNLEDVQFETIATKVEIVGEDVKVQNMSISSNVLSCVVDGIYSFGPNTNLSIKIPLHTLRNEKRQSISGKKRTEKAIYLKAIDQNGSVNIMLDGKRSLR